MQVLSEGCSLHGIFKIKLPQNITPLNAPFLSIFMPVRGHRLHQQGYPLCAGATTRACVLLSLPHTYPWCGNIHLWHDWCVSFPSSKNIPHGLYIQYPIEWYGTTAAITYFVVSFGPPIHFSFFSHLPSYQFFLRPGGGFSPKYRINITVIL